MGSKNKLKRFRENETFKNVLQPERNALASDKFSLKGRWKTDFFKNDNPLVLELGCGKGEYTVHLAQNNPNINYIGIDIKGARFWRGAKTALETGLDNVGFIRTQIELISHCFAENEVDEIWITFPDPQIKYKRSKHRLTHPDFLSNYKRVLKPKGIIHLKTDSEFLFGYTLGMVANQGQILYAHHNIYNNSNAPQVATAIQTFYEKQFLEKGKAITYMQFRL
ncbi:tRNA (guanosine(46)-N7)-methyltransferase TrmB [Flavobacteriaceae bacterium]|nr:tRNA (guanosine(46)-N7)-methyltransferase TrmB [Flavobacteriaceae bacterium]